jgi:valyl-tRNA synthetase
VAVVGEVRLAIEVKIDVAAEVARLTKERQRLQGEIDKAEANLGNERFVQRAPANVVAEMRARVADFKAALVRIKAQLAQLTAEA